jgi:hypothetical protein
MASAAQSEPRTPKIFIIDSHGSSVIDKTRKKPVVVDSLVDTITTTGVGCELVLHSRNGARFDAAHTSDTFLEPPYRYFTRIAYDAIRHIVSSTDPHDITKAQYRDAILQSLRDTRDPTISHGRAHCLGSARCIGWQSKFRCHQLRKKITDMYLFYDGEPVDDQILWFDPDTGLLEDEHEMFGLEEKKKDEVTTFPSKLGPTKETLGIALGLREYEAETEALKQKLQTIPPIYRRPFIQHIKSREADLEKHRISLQGLYRTSKFRYNKILQQTHGDEPIKLSVILQHAISNGTIDPEIDFVIVFACRGPSMKLNYRLRSPRDIDETPSVGGSVKNRTTTKTKCKKNRKIKKTRKRRYCI